MNFLDVKDEETLQKLTKYYKDGVNVFVLIYMNGCGPCEQTKPEWSQLKNKKWENSIIAQIDKDVLPEYGSIFSLEKISGFPTIRHYSKGKEEDYNEPERNAELFEKWIDYQLADKTKPKSIHTGHFSSRRSPRSKKSKRLKKKHKTRRIR